MSSKKIKVKISDLKPTEHNPRQISKPDFEKLVKSLEEDPEFLEAREIVVDENLTILGGHQRVKALEKMGKTEIEVKMVEGWSEEKKRRFVIKDNIQNGEWDMDELANAWSDLPLEDWGLDWDMVDYDEMVETASDGTVKEYSEDTNYNLKNLYREKINKEIVDKIDAGVESGQIRPEIENILRQRASQCNIFNFDEIIKFYRSGDASETEKELLKRLYLVFITPKEAIESGMLEIEKASGEIYDNSLMEKLL